MGLFTFVNSNLLIIYITMVNNAAFTKRLSKILKEYELSAASFADKVQVGRATISHLLSGRNKPSLDFVMKVVDAFPEVDLYWLLKGEGVFPKLNEDFKKEPSSLSQEKSITEHISNTVQHPTIAKSEEKSNSAKNRVFEKIVSPSSNAQNIKRIVIFFQNGTFESYEHFS